MVTVNFFATIRGVTGEKEISMEALSIEELIKKLTAKYADPLFGKKIKGATMLVNGKNIAQIKGRKTKLNDNDVVSIFPPVGGG